MPRLHSIGPSSCRNVCRRGCIKPDYPTYKPDCDRTKAIALIDLAAAHLDMRNLREARDESDQAILLLNSLPATRNQPVLDSTLLVMALENLGIARRKPTTLEEPSRLSRRPLPTPSGAACKDDPVSQLSHGLGLCRAWQAAPEEGRIQEAMKDLNEAFKSPLPALSVVPHHPGLPAKNGHDPE